MRLQSGLCDDVLLERDYRLSQQPAVDRCAGIQGDHRLGQYRSLEVRGCPDGDCVSRLPEDVLGLRATYESHILGGSLVESAGNLEDEYVVRATREGDVV